MNHPFEKMFDKALKASTPEDNVVLEEAEALRQKGYSPQEIFDVLNHLKNALVQDKDLAILTEATDEFSRYL